MASAAWERRNASARAKGYASYYDYRAHNFGKIPADRPCASGDALRLLRGHSGVGDFERLLYSGRVELVNLVQTGPHRFEVLVTTSNGKQRSFTIRGQKQIDRLRQIVQRPEVGGPEGPKIIGSPRALRALAADLEAEEAAAIAEREPEEPYDPTDDDIPF